MCMVILGDSESGRGGSSLLAVQYCSVACIYEVTEHYSEVLCIQNYPYMLPGVRILCMFCRLPLHHIANVYRHIVIIYRHIAIVYRHIVMVYRHIVMVYCHIAIGI